MACTAVLSSVATQQHDAVPTHTIMGSRYFYSWETVRYAEEQIATLEADPANADTVYAIRIYSDFMKHKQLILDAATAAEFQHVWNTRLFDTPVERSFKTHSVDIRVDAAPTADYPCRCFEFLQEREWKGESYTVWVPVCSLCPFVRIPATLFTDTVTTPHSHACKVFEDYSRYDRCPLWSTMRVCKGAVWITTQ